MSTRHPATLARVERIRRIRRRGVATAAATFAAAWAIVFVQLVSGHDPALTSHGASAHAASGAATTSTSGSANATASSPTPVTTSQS